MSDIFREVDEDVRREQLVRLWKQYGAWVLGALGLALIIAGGWTWWRNYQESQRMEDSEAFAAALSVAAEGEAERFASALETTLPELSGGYEVLARLRLAANHAESGRVEDAVASYDALASDSSIPARLRSFAQIQAAMALMGRGRDEEVFARLDPLAVPGRPYYHLAHELRGYLLWDQGRLREAYEVFDELAVNTSGPPGVRRRANQMRDMLDSRVSVAPGDEQESEPTAAGRQKADDNAADRTGDGREDQ